MKTKEDLEKFAKVIEEKLKYGEGTIYLECRNCTFKRGWFTGNIRRLFLDYEKGCPHCGWEYKITRL